MAAPASQVPNANRTYTPLQPNRTPLSFEKLSSSFGPNRSPSDAEPLIKWELRGNIQDVPVQKFIDSLLLTPPALDLILQALKQQPIEQALSQFGAATREIDLYQPLETLINSSIKIGYSLTSNTQVALPVAYVALGSVPLGGSRRVRKPDGVLIESVLASRYQGENLGVVHGEEQTTDPTKLGDRSLEPAPNQASPAISSASKPVKEVKKQEVPPWVKALVSFEVRLHRTGITKEHSGATSPSQSGSAQPSSPASSQQFENNKRVSSENHSESSKQRKVVQEDLQIAGYLAEMRSALGNRTHTFGCAIHGGYFEFWFADPIGVIRSAPLKLSEHLAKFALVIIGFATCGPEELGFDKNFISPLRSASVIPDNLTGWHYQIDEGCKVKILDVRDVRWCLGGRGTAVYVIEWDGNRAILKMSHPFAIREREAVLLRKARGWVQDGVTQILHDTSKEAVSAGFRKKLVGCVELALDRRQEVLVLELLWELNCVRHIEDYTDAFIEIIQNLHTLYKNGRILHRDISSANLMMRPNSNNKPRGVINDFDLAVDLNVIPEHDHSLIHRTGTLPFLAIELLSDSPPRHIFRFDLESCLYVYLWDAVHYMHGEPNKTNKGDEIITAWASAHPQQNAFAKVGLPHLLMVEPELFGDCQKFALHIASLLSSLMAGKLALKNAESTGRLIDAAERETLAGHFTFEKVLETFNAIQAMYKGPHPFPQRCKDPNQPFEYADTGDRVASAFHTLGKDGCSPFYDPLVLGKIYVAPEAPSA